ncbi:MAG: 30S ribosomal protein S21 [Candidatus Levyibacteriota bacterium]
MVFIKKQPGDSNDSMIRKFSRSVATEGIMLEMKKREFYTKPSGKRKLKRELIRKFAKQQMRST